MIVWGLFLALDIAAAGPKARPSARVLSRSGSHLFLRRTISVAYL